MKLKTNIIHLVIVGVLTIGFISGCNKEEEEDPKYKSMLCPRCFEIAAGSTSHWLRVLGQRCKKCGLKFGSGRGDGRPFSPWLENRSYSGSASDAQIAEWLAEAEAEEAAKAKAEREIEELNNP